MKRFTVLVAGLLLWAGAAHAAEKWNMPTAYGNANYHTQNARLFAKAVGVCTGGKLEIVVHGGGSLIKGGEIKRAVQNGKAPIGERLLSAHQTENAVFGFRLCAAAGYLFRCVRKTLEGGQKPADEDSCRAEPRAALLRPLAAAGDVFQARDRRRLRHAGHQVPRLQRRDGAFRRTRRNALGAHRAGGTRTRTGKR